MKNAFKAHKPTERTEYVFPGDAFRPGDPIPSPRNSECDASPPTPWANARDSPETPPCRT